MSYVYSYLIADIVLLLVWLILFLLRKDLRKQMFIFSFTVGLLSPFAELVHILDWWYPLTITGTRIGIEDFLFGFAIAGIASVIYKELFSKQVRLRKRTKQKHGLENKNLFLIFILLLALFFGSFYLLKLNSFYSSVIAFLIPTLFIWIKRKDLIFDSLMSGLLLMIVSFVGFIVIETIAPGWVASTWNFKTLSGIMILYAPIEDLMYFFLAGCFYGPLYEFWKEGKLVKRK